MEILLFKKVWVWIYIQAKFKYKQLCRFNFINSHPLLWSKVIGKIPLKSVLFYDRYLWEFPNDNPTGSITIAHSKQWRKRINVVTIFYSQLRWLGKRNAIFKQLKSTLYTVFFTACFLHDSLSLFHHQFSSLLIRILRQNVRSYCTAVAAAVLTIHGWRKLFDVHHYYQWKITQLSHSLNISYS